MIRPLLFAFALAAVLAPGDPLEAQERYDLETSLLLRYSVYDVGVGVEGAAGLGGRMGLFLSPTMVWEFEGVYSRPRVTDAPASVVHELYQTRLVLMHWLGGRGALVLGAGLAYDHYRGATRTVGARGLGPSGLMGLRFRLGDNFSLRFDGTGYLVPPDDSAQPIARTQTLNLAAQAAVSVLMRSPEGR